VKDKDHKQKIQKYKNEYDSRHQVKIKKVSKLTELESYELNFKKFKLEAPPPTDPIQEPKEEKPSQTRVLYTREEQRLEANVLGLP